MNCGIVSMCSERQAGVHVVLSGINDPLPGQAARLATLSVATHDEFMDKRPHELVLRNSRFTHSLFGMRCKVVRAPVVQDILKQERSLVIVLCQSPIRGGRSNMAGGLVRLGGAKSFFQESYLIKDRENVAGTPFEHFGKFLDKAS